MLVPLTNASVLFTDETILLALPLCNTIKSDIRMEFHPHQYQ